MSGNRRWVVPALVLAAVFAFALSACGSSDSDSSSSTTSSESTSGGESSSGGDSLAAAESQVEEAYAGRYTEPSSKPSPAAKGKDVWFISAGQASPNAAELWNGVKEAGEKIGWNISLFDAKLDPSKFPEGIRQAVASGADGMVSMVDCGVAKSAYEAARKAGVASVTIVAFDCDETEPGAEALTSAPISLGDRYSGWPDAYQAWGSDLAAWTIAQSEGEANVINATNEEFALINNLGMGYAARMEECAECEVTSMPWTVSEAGAKLAAKVQATILREPEANALQDSANPQLGMSQGVVQSGKAGEIKVVGGLGLPEDIALLKEEGKGLDGWPINWMSWAAVDTLNSVFNEAEPEDSGLGWQMIDLEHNLPSGDDFEPEVDYKAVYTKRWGQ